MAPSVRVADITQADDGVAGARRARSISSAGAGSSPRCSRTGGSRRADRAVGQVQVGPDGWSPRAGTPRCRGCRRPKRGTLTRCGPRSSPGATLGSRSSGRGTPARLFVDARHRNDPAAARRGRMCSWFRGRIAAARATSWAKSGRSGWKRRQAALWHQMEDGVSCSFHVQLTRGLRRNPRDVAACRRDRWSQASVRTSTRAWRSRGDPGGRCRTDACLASRSSAAATVGDWQQSTAGGEHRSGRICPRLRGCVLSSARS